MKIAVLWRWLLVIIAACAILAGAGWWLLSREAALEWLVAEVVRRSEGALTVEGVEGSVFGPIRVRRLAYETEVLRLTLEDATVNASARELAHGRVAIDSVEVRTLRLEMKPSAGPSRPPSSLALPLPVSIGRASIRSAELQGHKVREISFAYDGGPQEHALRALTADSDFGRIGIDFSVAAQSPFVLRGRATVTRKKQADDWSASAAISGSLARVVMDAAATMQAAQAQATARVAPFEPRWLDEFELRIEGVDLAAFDARLPRSELRIDISGIGGETGGLPEGRIRIANQRPGTLTAGRMPLAEMNADYAVRERQVDLTKLHATLGAAGTLAGSVRVSTDGASADLTVHALDLRALHEPLRATRLDGAVRAELSKTDQRLRANLTQRGMRFALDAVRRGDAVTITQFRAVADAGEIRGSGTISLTGPRRYAATATLMRFDAAKYGEYPATEINGELKLDGALEPEWRANIHLALGASRFRGTRLTGNAAGEFSSRGMRNVAIALTAGVNVLHASGAFGRPEDALAFALEAKRLAQLDSRVTGALNATGRIAGTMAHPVIDVGLSASALAWKGGARFEALGAHLAGTAARHVLTLQAKSSPFDFAGRLEGAWEAPRGWTGSLVSFENKGTYPVVLTAPAPVRLGRAQLTAGPAEARVAGGRVSLAALSWSDGKLDTRGELSNVPVAPLLAAAGASASSTDLRVGGQWSLATTSRLNGTVTLFRESGDIVYPGDTPVPLQLERLHLDARVVDDAIDGTLDVAAPSLVGRVRLAVASLARDAPLKAEGKADVSSLKLLAPLVGTRAVVDGRATLTLIAAGTLGAPRLTGNLAARDLRVDSPQYGVRLRDGTLHAELVGDTIRLHELTIRAGEGRLSATGTTSRTGTGETKLEWRADNFQIFDRPDVRLTLDGAGTVGIGGGKLMLRGGFAARRGYFEIERGASPRLSSDVVVLGRPRAAAAPPKRTRFETSLVDLDILLDLTNPVRLVGSGIDTHLGGKLQLRSNKQGAIEARGTLDTSRGVYYAFGQRLEIERGHLIFDGSLENPSLDILAKRKNLQVEAGVEVTGTARVPRVQLVSQPPVPDSEKLAWLILGRPLHELTDADVALLQVAAGTLVAGGSAIPVSRQIANRVGLDDLSLQGGGVAGSQIVALGKRFSDKLYVEYLQGLAATSAILRLSYVLTRTISLRVEAGALSTFGISFNRSFD